MRFALLPICLWMMIAAAQAEKNPDSSTAETPSTRLMITLVDGSRIVGTAEIDRLKITMDYAAPEIKLEKLRMLELTNGSARMNLRAGDILNGKLTATEIPVKTSFGEAKIPMAVVRTVQVISLSGGGAMPEGLVLHYTFDANDGGNIADASNSGNDGSVHGATFVKEGKMGGALSFSGNQQGVVGKNLENLRLQNFTIMAWVKRGGLAKISETWPQALIVGYGESGYNIGLDAPGHLFVGKVGEKAVFSTCKIEDTDFHHMVVTKNGSKVMFYLDGNVFAGEDFETHFEFGTGIGVGARPDTFEASFFGLIDEVAIFNRALTEDEVKGIYESQK